MANLFEKLIADLERRRVKRRLKAAFARNPRPAKPRDVTPPEGSMLRNAARARLLDSDLSNLTERGAKAWAGVDAQKLREDGTT